MSKYADDLKTHWGQIQAYGRSRFHLVTSLTKTTLPYIHFLASKNSWKDSKQLIRDNSGTKLVEHPNVCAVQKVNKQRSVKSYDNREENKKEKL